MRVVKLSLFGLLLMPLALALAAPPLAPSPCAPNHRQSHPVHIAWIHCQGNYDEVVVILNATGEDLDLTGYELTSKVGQKFRFQPSLVNPGCCVLKAYDTLRIHSGRRNLEPFADTRDLHWLNEDGQPRKEPVWRDSHDAATLLDGDKNVMAVYEYGQP